MAYQSIGRGTSANDGTGDDLRSGAGKINANFVEVYNKLGNGSALTSDTVTLNTATQTLTNKTLTAPTITGAGAIAGVFTGNITGNVTGNCSGTSGSTTGNAATATALATARTIAGQSFDGTGNITIASTDLSNTSAITLLTATQTLTNKTLTAPIVGGSVTTASGNLDLDPATQIVEVKGDGSSVEGQIKLNCHANSHGQTIKAQPHSAAVTNTMLLPDGANSTLVSKVSADVLTNKTLADLKTSVQTISGAGAVDLVTGVTEITTTGAQAYTLADGVVGQLKVITMVVDGGDATLTPATLNGASTITFNDAGDTVLLVYVTTLGWTVISNSGATVA
jgi:hypothetical protein